MPLFQALRTRTLTAYAALACAGVQASVFVAVELALKIVAILGQHQLIQVSETIRIYITVLSYGAGVDYCLFLIARYREERQAGADWGDALAKAIENVGPALTASAATVMFGIGMMAFARFGKFHHAGITVAFSLFVGLCTVLTFTTTLLRLTGPLAFWPFVPTGEEQKRDNAEELELKAKLEGELPVEQDLTRWFGLFGAPI